MTTSSSVQPIRAGVIGLGWAGETHLQSYLQVSGVEVVAIADPRTEHTAALGKKYNIPYTYSDPDELIARDDLDVISVATPNYLHAPLTIAAIKNGKHVLCEKPIARNTAEGEAMVRAAIEHGRVLKIAFNHRRRGDVQTLKRLVDEGALGHIYHGKATWMRRSGIPGMGGWFTTKEMAGGGPLIDLGVHVLDMALYLMGEPKVVSVTAATYAELGPRGRGSRGDTIDSTKYEVEDLGTAFIRLENGVTLLLEASWAVYGRQEEDFGVILYGNEGGAELLITPHDPQTLRFFNDTAGVPAVTLPKTLRGEGHLAVVREFITAIREGNWKEHVGRDGLRRAQIIEACYRSAAEGREIAVDDLASAL